MCTCIGTQRERRIVHTETKCMTLELTARRRRKECETRRRRKECETRDGGKNVKLGDGGKNVKLGDGGNNVKPVCVEQYEIIYECF